MFVELWSSDVDVHGDSESTVAKVNLTGWPFNLDLSGAHEYKLAAFMVQGSDDAFVGVFTVSLQDNRILIAGHGLIDGEQIRFELDDPATCTLPFPLNESDYYFVIGARGNDFQVSSTAGGALINMTDRGVGSNEVWKHSGSGTKAMESLEQIACAQEPGNFMVITFPEPIPGGETRTVRLRAKVFV